MLGCLNREPKPSALILQPFWSSRIWLLSGIPAPVSIKNANSCSQSNFRPANVLSWLEIQFWPRKAAGEQLVWMGTPCNESLGGLSPSTFNDWHLGSAAGHMYGWYYVFAVLLRSLQQLRSENPLGEYKMIRCIIYHLSPGSTAGYWRTLAQLATPKEPPHLPKDCQREPQNPFNFSVHPDPWEDLESRFADPPELGVPRSYPRVAPNWGFYFLDPPWGLGKV